MRNLTFICLACLFCSATAQTPRATGREVFFLTEQIKSLPVEDRAYLLFQGLSLRSELTHDHSVQQSLRDIFDQASQAKHQFPSNFAVASDIDSLESQGARAVQTEKVDTLEIRVQAMTLLSSVQLPIYKYAASTLPVLPQATCRDAAVSNDAPLMKLYAKESDLWLSKHEITERGLHDDIALRIGRAQSAITLNSIALLLTTIPLSNIDLIDLSDKLARQAAQINVTSRELGSLLNDGQIIANFSKLASRLETQGANSREIITALRVLLLSGSRDMCKDATYRPATVASAFNTVVASHPAYVADIHLQESDMTGETLEPPAQLHPIDPAGSDDAAMKTLSRYSTRADTGVHVEDLDGWEAASDALLKSLEHEISPPECATCFLFQMSLKYFLLADYSPEQAGSQAKRRALESYTKFLIDSPVKLEDPSLWIYQLEIPLGLSRTADENSRKTIDEYHSKGFHLMGLPSPSADVVPQVMYWSNDAIVHNFALAERLFKPRYHAPF